MSFTGFGFWQLGRHSERLGRNAVAEARLARPTVDVQVALEAAGEAGAEAATVDPLAYRRVRASGTFDPAYEVLRRPVARDGSPGFHVVTPLVLEDGRALLVERGWVPQALDRVPVVAAPPPPGVVTIEGWLFPPQRPPTGWLAALAPRDPPEGVLRTAAYLDVERLSQQMPFELVPAVVLLGAPERAPGDLTLPLPPRPPLLDAGPHLGYALQWFAFALIGLIGYAALLRSVVREERRRH